MCGAALARDHASHSPHEENKMANTAPTAQGDPRKSTSTGTRHDRQAWSVLAVSTLAFTVCFMVWMMFGIIGIPIKKMLDLNATQFGRSEEHTSELQSPCNLVCRLLLEKKKKNIHVRITRSTIISFVCDTY